MADIHGLKLLRNDAVGFGDASREMSWILIDKASKMISEWLSIFLNGGKSLTFPTKEAALEQACINSLRRSVHRRSKQRADRRTYDQRMVHKHHAKKITG